MVHGEPGRFVDESSYFDGPGLPLISFGDRAVVANVVEWSGAGVHEPSKWRLGVEADHGRVALHPIV